jgi:hypothetical protein
MSGRVIYYYERTLTAQVGNACYDYGGYNYGN